MGDGIALVWNVSGVVPEEGGVVLDDVMVREVTEDCVSTILSKQGRRWRLPQVYGLAVEGFGDGANGGFGQGRSKVEDLLEGVVELVHGDVLAVMGQNSVVGQGVWILVESRSLGIKQSRRTQAGAGSAAVLSSGSYVGGPETILIFPSNRASWPPSS